MFKSKYLSFLYYNKFNKFGEQVVHQFVIFECKWLFSLIFFYFEKTTGIQDRFHTHAFNALSIKLFGTYEEHVLMDQDKEFFRIDQRTQIFKWFPKNHFHRIAKSKGCLTFLISGPWESSWKEYIKGEIVNYTWGRK